MSLVMGRVALVVGRLSSRSRGGEIGYRPLRGVSIGPSGESAGSRSPMVLAALCPPRRASQPEPAWAGKAGFRADARGGQGRPAVSNGGLAWRPSSLINDNPRSACPPKTPRPARHGRRRVLKGPTSTRYMSQPALEHGGDGGRYPSSWRAAAPRIVLAKLSSRTHNRPGCGMPGYGFRQASNRAAPGCAAVRAAGGGVTGNLQGAPRAARLRPVQRDGANRCGVRFHRSVARQEAIHRLRLSTGSTAGAPA